MTRQHFSLLLIGSILGFSAPAYAQDSEMDGSRVEKLERDMMLLQRQIARSGVSGSADSGAPDVPAAGAARSEVRLNNLEQQVRELRGKLEENDFQNRRTAESLEKLQRDIDFRLQELERAKAAPAAVEPAAAAEPTKPTKPDADGKREKPANNPDGDTEDTTAGDGVIHVEEDAAAADATPRDLYNHAFRLLNQTKYDKAAEAFASFIQKYPKDPLVGNAHYWHGETFYIRRDYVSAADSFRQGFESLPSGPKAPDNLLKLAMSLNALKRDKEACIVLGQVVTKFKKTSSAVTQKAEQEQKRMNCK
jgi:tol-pal system protein YbgF